MDQKSCGFESRPAHCPSRIVAIPDASNVESPVRFRPEALPGVAPPDGRYAVGDAPRFPGGAV